MNKRKLVLSILVSVMVIIMVMSGCSESAPTATTEPATTEPATTTPAETTAPAEVIELKFSHPYSTVSSHVPPLDAWGSKVEQLTDGQVKVVFYPAGSLVADADSYTALTAGVCDIAIITAWLFPQLELETLFNLPFLGVTNENFLTVRKQLDEEFPEMAAVRSDFKTLWLMNTPLAGMATRNTEIHVPADIKGMTFISPVTMEMFYQECEATTVGLVPTEFYAALEKGVVDGVGASYGMLAESSLDEVLQYYLEVPVTGSCMDVMMNLDRWNSLTPEIQEILEGTFAEVEQAAMDAQLDEDAATRDQIVASGSMTIIVPTEEEVAQWAAMAQSTQQAWVDSMAEKGYPSQAAYDKLMEIIARN